MDAATGLYCDLTRSLEDVSCSSESNASVLYAAVLLSCLRYRDPGHADYNIDLIKDTLDILDQEHHAEFLDGIAGHCRTCARYGTCLVGSTFLNHAKYSAAVRQGRNDAGQVEPGVPARPAAQ